MLTLDQYIKKIQQLYSNKKLPSFITLNYDSASNESVQELIRGTSSAILNRSLSNKSLKNMTELLWLQAEKKYFLLEQIVQIKPFLLESNRDAPRICFLDSAKNLNTLNMNKLLKILEEPNENSFIFLINKSNASVLPTVQSRSISFFIKSSQLAEDQKQLSADLWRFFEQATDNEEEYLKSFIKLTLDPKISYKQKKQTLAFMKWAKENNALQLPIKERLYHLFYLWKNISNTTES